MQHFACFKQHFEKLNLGSPQYRFTHHYYSSACCAGAFARVLVNKMGPQTAVWILTLFSRNHWVQMQVQMQVQQAQLKSPSRLIKHAVHLFRARLRGFVSASVQNHTATRHRSILFLWAHIFFIRLGWKILFLFVFKVVPNAKSVYTDLLFGILDSLVSPCSNLWLFKDRLFTGYSKFSTSIVSLFHALLQHDVELLDRCICF